MSMKYKVIIITGGSSGIGRACVESFGKAGGTIVFTGRNEERMKETKAFLTSNGIEHLGISMDVSSEESNRKLVEQTIKKFGKIDIIINNAGISMRALFEDLELEAFKKVFDINFYGSIYLTKYALPHLLQSKGVIVGISSINGHRSTPARIAYNSSKYALEGFYETLRMEVMKRGVHVLVVSPGFTASNIRNAALDKNGSPQSESPRDESKMMQPEEVARAVIKGIKRKKRDVLLTTQGKMLVFLNKFTPGLLDKIVYNYMAREPDSPLKNR